MRSKTEEKGDDPGAGSSRARKGSRLEIRVEMGSYGEARPENEGLRLNRLAQVLDEIGALKKERPELFFTGVQGG